MSPLFPKLYVSMRLFHQQLQSLLLLITHQPQGWNSFVRGSFSGTLLFTSPCCSDKATALPFLGEKSQGRDFTGTFCDCKIKLEVSCKLFE